MFCGIRISAPFFLRESRASETRARVKITPREKRLHAACRLFSRGVIFTPARFLLALLSLRKMGDYSKSNVLQSFDRNAGHQKTLIKCRCSSKKWFCTNEKTRTAKRMRFSQYLVGLLSTASAWTRVILAGKCISRRRSTTSFSENVVVAKISNQVLEALKLCYQEKAQPLSIQITFLVRRVQ